MLSLEVPFRRDASFDMQETERYGVKKGWSNVIGGRQNRRNIIKLDIGKSATPKDHKSATLSNRGKKIDELAN